MNILKGVDDVVRCGRWQCTSTAFPISVVQVCVIAKMMFLHIRTEDFDAKRESHPMESSQCYVILQNGCPKPQQNSLRDSMLISQKLGVDSQCWAVGFAARFGSKGSILPALATIC